MPTTCQFKEILRRNNLVNYIQTCRVLMILNIEWCKLRPVMKHLVLFQSQNALYIPPGACLINFINPKTISMVTVTRGEGKKKNKQKSLPLWTRRVESRARANSESVSVASDAFSEVGVSLSPAGCCCCNCCCGACWY